MPNAATVNPVEFNSEQEEADRVAARLLDASETEIDLNSLGNTDGALAPSPPPAPQAIPPKSVIDEGLNPHRWIILVALVLASILELLDTTSVTVAVPQMMGNLGATVDEIGWVSTSYILSNVIVLPMTAWLSARFGRKRYLVLSILLFTAASFMCGTAGSLGVLIFWRILQGVGGAALISTAQSTLVEIFPRSQVALVQSLFAFGLIVAPTLGPTFGGWMVDNYSWQWIFFAKSPLGLLAAFLVWRFLHDTPFKNPSSKIDWTGIGLLAVGLGSLQYVLEEGNRYDWLNDPTIAKLTITAIVALLAFIGWELNRKNAFPIVDLRVLKDRSLTAGVLLQFVLGFGLYGATFVIPQFVQGILGFTPTESGLVLLPGGLVMAAAALFSGQSLQRGMDPRILVAIGVPINILSMWTLAHLAPMSGFSDVDLGLIWRGLGSGLLFTPIVVCAFAGLQGRSIAQGAGLLNLARQLGGSLSIAMLSTYVDHMIDFHRAVLIGAINPDNSLLQQRMQGAMQVLVQHGYSVASAQAAALGLISHLVDTQSAMLAYDDCFLFVAIAFLVTYPLVFILRKPKMVKPTADVH